MKKILLIISLVFLAGCSLNKPEKFAVYLLDTNREVFSEDDLISYDLLSGIFTFTEEGAQKMKSYQTSREMNAGLYQKSFFVKVGDQEIYSGKFWTNLSSLSEPGIVITDVVMIEPDYNTLTVEASYPSGGINEVINNSKIIEHFKKIGKLIEESESENLVLEDASYSLKLPAPFKVDSGMSDGYIRPKTEGDFPEIKLNFLPSSKENPSTADILNDEKTYMSVLCSDTDGCGEITEWNAIMIDGREALRYTIKYQGRNLEDREGFIKEYRYSIPVRNPYEEPLKTILLHFSISINDLESTDALKVFEEIMKTISFKVQ